MRWVIMSLVAGGDQSMPDLYGIVYLVPISAQPCVGSDLVDVCVFSSS